MGGVRLEGREIEQKGKRTHRHRYQCGHCRGEGGIRGLNGDGKNTIKITVNKKKVLTVNGTRC